MSDDARPHEIIIIKRHRGDHEDAHHGGSWKIAYADFVTAMMAFFLVMWLLSANDKTKAAIVKYFNPVQLVDSTSQPPGLDDPKDNVPNPKQKDTAKPVPNPKQAPAAGEAGGQDAKPAEGKSAKDEAALFKDPYAVLADIAAKDAPEPARLPAGKNDGAKGGAGATGAAGIRGGEAFRDPFEPVAMPPAATLPPAAILPPTAISPPAAKTLTGSAAPAPEPASAPLPADAGARAAELRNRIGALMKTLSGASSGSEPKLEVRATPEGVLIALTDDARFSMFASASAEPAPRTVVLMENVGKLLKGQTGKVTIRGFTDSRKFKSDTYDNWRLSSARAHMTHYMLARGGLDDARIERIEGYADRQPRNAKDPESPENRRIEILLREAP